MAAIRVGLDFHETITSHPSHFRRLANAILKGGGEVYIITAVKGWNTAKVLDDIKKTGIKYTDIDVISFTDYDAVPELKLWKAKERGIDFMIDDRLDTCQLMTDRGITGLCVTQRRQNEDIIRSKRDSGRLETERPEVGRNRGERSRVGSGVGISRAPSYDF